MVSPDRPHPYTITFKGPKELNPVTYVVMAETMQIAVPKAVAFAAADCGWGPKPEVEMFWGGSVTFRGAPSDLDGSVDRRPADEPVGIPARTPREVCRHPQEHDRWFIVGYVVTVAMMTLPMSGAAKESRAFSYRDVAYVPGDDSGTHEIVEALRFHHHATFPPDRAAFERATGPTPMFTESQPVYAGAHRH